MTNDDSDHPSTSQKSYRLILIEEIIQGLGELRRSASGLFISGLSAGLDIGFSVLLMATAITLLGTWVPESAIRLLTANLYAVGFLLVVLGRSELFTEHTTLAVFPVLAEKASLWDLLRLWGIVWTANVIGAGIFSGLATLIGPRLNVDPEAFVTIADPLVDQIWWVILLSGLLAGWLMGLMSWLVAAAEETIGQIFFVWLVASAIGLLHLHHCIVGTVEVLCGVFVSGELTAWHFGHFLLWATLGNALGGVVFVAVVKYGHVVRSREERGKAAPPGAQTAEGPPHGAGKAD